MDSFGKRLEEAIKISGLKKERLAQLVNISKNMISRYIKNQNIPNINTVKLLCHYTGADLVWLVTGFEPGDYARMKMNRELSLKVSEDRPEFDRHETVYTMNLFLKLNSHHRNTIRKMIEVLLKDQE